MNVVGENTESVCRWVGGCRPVLVARAKRFPALPDKNSLLTHCHIIRISQRNLRWRTAHNAQEYMYRPSHCRKRCNERWHRARERTTGGFRVSKVSSGPPRPATVNPARNAPTPAPSCPSPQQAPARPSRIEKCCDCKLPVKNVLSSAPNPSANPPTTAMKFYPMTDTERLESRRPGSAQLSSRAPPAPSASARRRAPVAAKRMPDSQPRPR